MSEFTEKTLGVGRLPIFPLPVVLVPLELTPFHIFEPRYRQMLEDIQLGNNLFGVSLFEPKTAALMQPAIGSIGCAADLRQVERSEDGTSDILTAGIRRYLIDEYVDVDSPYLVAEVTFFEDLEEDLDLLDPLADEVFELFMRLARASHKLAGERGAIPEIPKAAPEDLSFLITAAFSLDLRLKYYFLELRSTSERLSKLKEILERAVVKVEDSAEINKVAKTNGHSKKKINI
jgi:ATP-dependent Lon protease